MDDLKTTLNAQLPLRYGIGDLIGVVLLVGMHMALLFKLPGFEPEADRLAALISLSLLFPVGAGYLAFRFATEKKIRSPLKRLLLLFAFDLGLLLVILGWILIVDVRRFPG